MQQTSIKRMGGKCDSLGTVQEIKVWLMWQMVNAQTRNCPRKGDKILLDFEIQKDH